MEVSKTVRQLDMWEYVVKRCRVEDLCAPESKWKSTLCIFEEVLADMVYSLLACCLTAFPHNNALGI